MDINLSSPTFSDEEAEVFAQLLIQLAADPKVIEVTPEALHLVKMPNGTIRVAILKGGVLIVRKARPDNHPDRVWFDVKAEKAFDKGNEKVNTFLYVAPRSFRVERENGKLKLICKSRPLLSDVKNQKIAYAYKVITLPSSSPTLAPEIKALENEMKEYLRLYFPKKPSGSLIQMRSRERVRLYARVPMLPGKNVMELVEKDVSQNNRITIKEGQATHLKLTKILSILLQAAELLKKMHEDDRINFDVKPDNILVGDELVYLCDFGYTLSKESLGDYFGVVGTDGYIAPEIQNNQADGLKKMTDKVDAYSFGCIIEILTDSYDFQNECSSVYEFFDACLELDRKLKIREFFLLNDHDLYFGLIEELFSFEKDLKKKSPEKRKSIADFCVEFSKGLSTVLMTIYPKRISDIIQQLEVALKNPEQKNALELQEMIDCLNAQLKKWQEYLKAPRMVSLMPYDQNRHVREMIDELQKIALKYAKEKKMESSRLFAGSSESVAPSPQLIRKAP